jgi:hypothetical protein
LNNNKNGCNWLRAPCFNVRYYGVSSSAGNELGEAFENEIFGRIWSFYIDPTKHLFT